MSSEGALSRILLAHMIKRSLSGLSASKPELTRFFWQAVSGETSTRMNFIDKNASFDTGILVHEGFGFFDRSVKDRDPF